MPQELLIVQFLLCSPFLFQGNGATKRKGPEFTKEEESLIIQEMLDYPAISVSLYNTNLWRTIADKNNEMFRTETPGFLKERTPVSLNAHFRKVMRKSKGKVPVPEMVWQKFKIPHDRKKNKAQSRSSTGEYMGNKKACSCDIRGKRYNAEEDELLIEEVLKYPVRPISIHGRTMWEDIADHLKEKRRENPARFVHARTASALHHHFMYILNCKLKGEERDNLIKEIQMRGPVRDEGAMEITLRHKFTQEEDDFIINEALQPSCCEHNRNTWKVIKEKHDGKRLLKTPGFNQATARRVSQLRGEESNLQVIDEDDTEVWESMIEELLCKSAYDDQFGLVDNMAPNT